jgi:radical SAM superfamily enzyme YgiQ (UPF0313 family)
MRVLIISANRNAQPVPVLPAGACIVAEAAERAGHRVRLLDLMFRRHPEEALAAELRANPPDVVGLSVRNIDNNDVQEPVFFARELAGIVRAIRRRTDAPVVLGGAALGVMPGELLRLTGADFAVTGEGDRRFPELLENISRPEGIEKTAGVAWLKDGTLRTTPQSPPALSACPPSPDYRRWIDLRAYVACMATVPLQTKLGCHFKCIYCTYGKIQGNAYRCFEPDSVAGAVEAHVSQGLRDVELVDNVFNSPYAHALAVCDSLARAQTGARLHSLELNPLLIDDGLLDAMEEAGFRSMGITAESASDRVLQGLGKGFSRDDVARAAEAVRRHRIPCLWIFMLGGPGETKDTVRETLRFAEHSIRPGDVAFFNAGVRIYPGTGLEQLARREGLLSLGRGGMLEPVFYLSPELDPLWLMREITLALARNMNFTGSSSIGYPHLTAINRLGYRLGVRPPLWRYARHIRRGLRLLGCEA